MKIILDKEEIENIVTDWCRKKFNNMNVAVEQWETGDDPDPEGISIEMNDIDQIEAKAENWP